MQRIRKTDRGLQFTQEMDVASLRVDSHGNISADLMESSLKDEVGTRLFIIEGRDNIRDFGSWLISLTSDRNEPPVASGFHEYTQDPYTHLAAVTVEQTDPGPSLASILGGSDERMGSAAREDLNAFLATLHDAVGGNSRRPKTRIENVALCYPFGIADNMTPILVASQTHDKLSLQFDELLVHTQIPFEGAKQLGQWTLQGLAEIQKKSIWGS